MIGNGTWGVRDCGTIRPASSEDSLSGGGPDRLAPSAFDAAKPLCGIAFPGHLDILVNNAAYPAELATAPSSHRRIFLAFLFPTPQQSGGAPILRDERRCVTRLRR